jgi:putative DNA primase/helicase
LDDLPSPIKAFLRECCEVGDSCQVEVKELYAHWQRWCEVKGNRATNAQVFGRDLRAVVPSLDVQQPRVGGQEVRFYCGIGLRPDVEVAGLPL